MYDCWLFDGGWKLITGIVLEKIQQFLESSLVFYSLKPNILSRAIRNVWELMIQWPHELSEEDLARILSSNSSSSMKTRESNSLCRALYTSPLEKDSTSSHNTTQNDPNSTHPQQHNILSGTVQVTITRSLLFERLCFVGRIHDSTMVQHSSYSCTK